ncbi:MAG: transglycosylase domain-containing protein [Eubacteriales bacterium]|nr:transglycosylase domain-containing protein [Eubacteriales bacterium]
MSDKDLKKTEQKPEETKEKTNPIAQTGNAAAAVLKKFKPRRDKHGSDKQMATWKKVLLIILVVILAIIIVGGVYTAVIISRAPKIDTDMDNIYSLLSQTTTVYDRNGKTAGKVYSGQNRINVKYKDLPENLVNAYVALEDKTFWKHHGFNWIRIMGAIKSAVTSGGSVSGTSTLTQQLARNVFLPQRMTEHSMKRKIIEAWYTVQLERNLSKEQIIEAYLNTIYLGFNTNGVGAASQAYFSKNIKDLSIAQCAVLASLPQKPTGYAPVVLVNNGSVQSGEKVLKRTSAGTYILNDAGKSRRLTCLKLMLDQGYITKAQYNKAVKVKLEDMIKPDYSINSQKASYFTDYVVNQVIKDLQSEQKLSYSEAYDKVYKGGLKIYSTEDKRAQKVVEREFSNNANFPNPTSLRYDSQGNMLNKYGTIVMYKYSNFVNNGRFTFASNEIKAKKDGSFIIKKNKRIRIYSSTYNGVTDYTLAFPNMYTNKNGKIYLISGGNINIPQKYKSLNKNGNVVISKDFAKSTEGKGVFKKDNNGNWYIGKNNLVINQEVIQPQAAMTIINNKNGQIIAMVGGRKAKGKMIYNRAVNTRQPGSSIKPLAIYSAALQQSVEEMRAGKTHYFQNYGIDKQGATGWGKYITEGSTVTDEPLTVNGKNWPKNSGGGYSGYRTLKTALQNSINTCAVKIFYQVGADYSAKMVKKYGISSLKTSGAVSDMNAAALALGGMTKGVSTLEMANAYTCFAGNGTKTEEPICYTKVVDSEGKTILKKSSKRVRVIDEGVAFIMRDMMKSVVTGGTGRNAAIAGTTVAGKTGTTSDEYDIWFDGYVPKYTASLWIGNDVNLRLSGMSNYAAALWGRIMRQIPNVTKGSYPAMPSDVQKVGAYYYVKGTYSYVAPPITNKNEDNKDNKSGTENSTNSTTNGQNSGNSGTTTNGGTTQTGR